MNKIFTERREKKQFYHTYIFWSRIAVRCIRCSSLLLWHDWIKSFQQTTIRKKQQPKIILFQQIFFLQKKNYGNRWFQINQLWPSTTSEKKCCRCWTVAVNFIFSILMYDAIELFVVVSRYIQTVVSFVAGWHRFASSSTYICVCVFDTCVKEWNKCQRLFCCIAMFRLSIRRCCDVFVCLN